MLCFYDFSCVYVMWCQIFLTLHLIEDILPQNSSTLKVVGSCGMGISMSWYSKNSSLTLSCSSGPLKGSSSWNLKRAPCVKNGLSICFVTMVQIKLKVLNMLKSWKMWNPCLSTKYRASSTPHSVLCCTSTNWACFSRASFRGSFFYFHTPQPWPEGSLNSISDERMLLCLFPDIFEIDKCNNQYYTLDKI